MSVSKTDSSPTAPSAGQVALSLLHPSTLFLIGADMVPIFGVVYWGWDVFVLLMLYWLETAVIGLWMIARIAIAPAGSLGPVLINGRPATLSSLWMAGFFLLHGGVFMGGHLLFLWVIFSGAWSEKIHGITDFYNLMVIENGLWIPLLLLFAARGFAFLVHAVRPAAILRLEQLLHLPTTVPAPAGTDAGSIVGEFYSRIIIMQVTIIASAFLAVIIGSLTPLIIMVALKTLADVALHLRLEFGHARKVRRTVASISFGRH